MLVSVLLYLAGLGFVGGVIPWVRTFASAEQCGDRADLDTMHRCGGNAEPERYE